MFEITRSPAKVSWFLMFNGILLQTYDTKCKAEQGLEEYKKLI